MECALAGLPLATQAPKPRRLWLVKTQIYSQRRTSTSFRGRLRTLILELRVQRPHAKNQCSASLHLLQESGNSLAHIGPTFCTPTVSCVSTETLAHFRQEEDGRHKVCGNGVSSLEGRWWWWGRGGRRRGPQLGLDEVKEERNVIKPRGRSRETPRSVCSETTGN